MSFHSKIILLLVSLISYWNLILWGCTTNHNVFHLKQYSCPGAFLRNQPTTLFCGVHRKDALYASKNHEAANAFHLF